MYNFIGVLQLVLFVFYFIMYIYKIVLKCLSIYAYIHYDVCIIVMII